MAEQQTELQKVRTALSELIGSEQALADFEAQQKQSPAYWQYMTKEYKKTHGLSDDGVASEARSDTTESAQAKKRGAIGQPSPQQAQQAQQAARH